MLQRRYDARRHNIAFRLAAFPAAVLGSIHRDSFTDSSACNNGARGAVIEPALVLEAASEEGNPLDNFEGLDVLMGPAASSASSDAEGGNGTQPAVMLLMSDDNMSKAQRTVLLTITVPNASALSTYAADATEVKPTALGGAGEEGAVRVPPGLLAGAAGVVGVAVGAGAALLIQRMRGVRACGGDRVYQEMQMTEV